MLEYAYNWQLWTENTNVSKTVKILSVSITELLQAKAWEKSNPEVPQVLKALRSNDSLFDCECTSLRFLRIPQGVYSIVM